MEREERLDQTRCAILVVSFGTSYPDAERQSISPVHDAISDAFPDCAVRSAFTSRRVAAILAGHGRAVEGPHDALERLHHDGYSRVIVAPLLFLAGHEFEKKVLEPCRHWSSRFAALSVCAPVLSDEEGIRTMADIAADLCESVGGEQLLLMGHGTDHATDSVYAELQEVIDLNGTPALIATVEGQTTLDQILPRLIDAEVRRVHLFPLMLVAGQHALHDMAGDDDKSWKSRLLSSGIEPIVHLNGIGERVRLRRIVIGRVRAARRALFASGALGPGWAHPVTESIGGV